MGHILRLKDERLIKQTLKIIFDNRQDGDILMDVDIADWTELQRAAADKDGWKSKVKVLKSAAQRTTKPKRTKMQYEKRSNAAQTARFTFFLPKTKKMTKKLNNDVACARRHTTKR